MARRAAPAWPVAQNARPALRSTGSHGTRDRTLLRPHALWRAGRDRVGHFVNGRHGPRLACVTNTDLYHVVKKGSSNRPRPWNARATARSYAQTGIAST